MNVEPRSQWVGRLSTEIKRAGFGVGEFAQRMGVNRTSVWRINRGDFAPSPVWTKRAEALLGLDRSYEVKNITEEPQVAA